MKDDRASFLASTEEKSLSLGQDDIAFRQSTDLLTELDRHDYAYLWTWMGLPIIQMPADVMTTQEIIWQTKPDVIIEVGVARGGSVVFLASMLALIGKGKVIGVDIDIRAHNRLAIENHQMAKHITLIEGSSIAEETVAKIRSHISQDDQVMIILDSNHSYQHVLDELKIFGPMVSKGQFLIVADTLLGRLAPDQTPTKRSAIWQKGNDPLTAVHEYLKSTDRFNVDPIVNGKQVLASSPGGYLRCVK